MRGDWTTYGAFRETRIDFSSNYGAVTLTTTENYSEDSRNFLMMKPNMDGPMYLNKQDARLLADRLLEWVE